MNAVATALKDFFKKYPSILTQEQMDEMEEISSTLIQRLSTSRDSIFKLIYSDTGPQLPIVGVA